MSSRRCRGNVGIPKGFPRSVGRVGSRLHGFPPFPCSVISMACFSRGKCWINRHTAAQCDVPHPPRDAHRDSSLLNQCIGGFAKTEIQILMRSPFGERILRSGSNGKYPISLSLEQFLLVTGRIHNVDYGGVHWDLRQRVT